ncbi:hypothetical protein PM082_014596 [Marasmius tenuissimus]|nr:hypothetical protein PM082_014596 [Marasmius tenuissimus]
MEVEDELEVWSLSPWRFISILWLADDHTPSEELASAVIDFDLYRYTNMILDQDYVKEAFQRVPTVSKLIDHWNRITSRRSDGDHIFLEGHLGLKYNFRLGLAGLYWELFLPLRLLTGELLYLQDMCDPTKITSKNDSMQLGCNQLSQFFEGDWLVILPKDGKNRNPSLSRLGCIAFFGVRPPPGISFDQKELFHFVFDVTEKINGGLPPIVKVLPHGELERATREFSGNAFQICVVSSQQRARFAEEVRTVRSHGGIYTLEFRDLVVKILTDTPNTTLQPDDTDDAGESSSQGVAVSRLFRAFSRRSS